MMLPSRSDEEAREQLGARPREGPARLRRGPRVGGFAEAGSPAASTRSPTPACHALTDDLASEEVPS